MLESLRNLRSDTRVYVIIMFRVLTWRLPFFFHMSDSCGVTFPHACHVCRIVKCDFNPRCDDEGYLSLVRGETILDLRKEEGGWLFGWSYRFGKSGWYPPGYVKTLEHVCSVYYNMQHTLDIPDNVDPDTRDNNTDAPVDMLADSDIDIEAHEICRVCNSSWHGWHCRSCGATIACLLYTSPSPRDS